jgi:hypothetical protein
LYSVKGQYFAFVDYLFIFSKPCLAFMRETSSLD